MALSIYPPNEKRKYAKVYGDFTGSHASFDTSEMLIYKVDEKTYKLFAYMLSFTGFVFKGDNKTSVFTPQIVEIEIHSDMYEKNTKEGDNFVKKMTDSSFFEKWFCQKIEANKDLYLNPNKPLAGSVVIDDGSVILSIYSGQIGGRILQQNEIDAMKIIADGFITLEPTELNLLKDVKLESSSTAKNFYSKKSPTEILNERKAFLIANLLPPEMINQETISIAYLAECLNAYCGENPLLLQTVNTLIKAIFAE